MWDEAANSTNRFVTGKITTHTRSSTVFKGKFWSTSAGCCSKELNILGTFFISFFFENDRRAAITVNTGQCRRILFSKYWIKWHGRYVDLIGWHNVPYRQRYYRYFAKCIRKSHIYPKKVTSTSCVVVATWLIWALLELGRAKCYANHITADD